MRLHGKSGCHVLRVRNMHNRRISRSCPNTLSLHSVAGNAVYRDALHKEAKTPTGSRLVTRMLTDHCLLRRYIKVVGLSESAL
jgi:hypothetical protein